MELKIPLLLRRHLSGCVLIVPFMELKIGEVTLYDDVTPRLNRTFYGIETINPELFRYLLLVLIVPFMELKHYDTEKCAWRCLS